MSRPLQRTTIRTQQCTFLGIAFLTFLALNLGAQTAAREDIRPLSEGSAVERELKGDAAHSYGIELRSGRFISVVVQQKGIDVVVSLFDPANKKIAEVDSPNGVEGPEPLSSISEIPGIYRLEVRSLDKDAQVGRYEVRIVEIRTASEEDKTRIAAQAAFAEGVGLQAQASVEGFRGAIHKYEKAAGLYKSVGDKDGEALALQSSAVLHRELGENELALDTFNKVLPLRRALGNKLGEADALLGIGFVYTNLGEQGQALKYYGEALPLARAAGDTVMEATILSNMGIVFSYLGEYEEALKMHSLSLPLLRSMGDKRAEATVLSSMGQVYAALGKWDRALEYFFQSLPVQRAVSDKAGEAATLNNIGATYRDLGDSEKAFKYYDEALEVRRIIGDRSGEAATLNNLAVVYADLGQKQKALQAYSDCLPLLRAIGDKRMEAITLDNLFTAWRGAGNPRLGVFFGKLSVGVYQVMRSRANSLDKTVQQSFLRSVDSGYRRLASALIEDRRYVEAQELLTLFKDQQVFDADRSTQASPLSFTPNEAKIAAAFEERVEEVAISVRALEGFKGRLAGAPSTPADDAEFKRLQVNFKSASDKFREYIRSSATRFTALADAESRLSTTESLRSMQDDLRRLSVRNEQASVAVYQLVGVDKFHSLVVSPNDITSASTPIKSTVLNRQAKTLWALVQSPEYDPRAVAKELYDIVVKPIEKVLPAGTKTILWSLDGNLRYVPVGALYDGKQYLVERYNNVVFTRADSNRLTRPVSSMWTADAFGSTKAHAVDLLGNRISFGALPGVETELDIIFGNGKKGGVLGGDVLRDDAFTRDNMLTHLQRKRPVVHIASHFSFQPGDDNRSFLVLGDGTAFTLADMKTQKDLFAGVELLTLSACNTAAQQADANGREVDAFFELAQRLGAQSVLATLWPVADNSTPWLMREFYYLKVNNKQNKAEALRNAQLALLNGSAKAARSATRSDASQVKIVVEADTPSGTTPSPQSGGDSSSSEQEGIAAATSPGTRRELNKTATRAETFAIAKKDAKPFVPDPKRPFAHPFYWSPFVLIGNWR